MCCDLPASLRLLYYFPFDSAKLSSLLHLQVAADSLLHNLPLLVQTLTRCRFTQVVRESDFLLYDDSLTPRTDSRHPFMSYSPASGLWTAAQPALAGTSEPAKELWLRQLTVEIPSEIASSRASSVKAAIDATVPKALEGVDCYRLDGRTCWSVETQPSLNRTARTYLFNSAEASKMFAANFVAQPSLKSDHLSLKARRSRNTIRRYTSFFSGNSDLASRAESDSMFDDVWISDDVDGLVEKSREDMRSAKWMLFAIRAFVMRFYGLAKVRVHVPMRRKGRC